MAHQVFADRGAAGHHVNDARGYSGLGCGIGHEEGVEHGFGSRLEHHGVSGCQRGGNSIVPVIPVITTSRIGRDDRSVIGQWWWTVDRWTLGALMALIAIGAVLSMAASPAVAVRIGYDPLHFVKRHLAAVPIALAIMFLVSLLPPRKIRRTAFVLFGVSLLMLAATLFIGMEIKGARRWINVAGLGIQPSELVKPTFAIVAAWLFAEQRRRQRIFRKQPRDRKGSVFATQLGWLEYECHIHSG